MRFLTHLKARSLNPKNSAYRPQIPTESGQFAHSGGPFASPGWVPKNLIIVALRGSAKVFVDQSWHAPFGDDIAQMIFRSAFENAKSFN
jgi:hypothetical protein